MVAGHLKFLSTLLQSKNLDLISAYEDIDAARLVLSDFLGNKAEFESLYKETSKLCDQTEIKRLTLRYENRQGLDHKDYAETVIFLPYLEALIASIGERFGKRQKVAFKLQYLLPARSKELTKEKIDQAVEQYSDFLPSRIDIESELLRRKVKWRVKGNELPSNVTETLADKTVILRYPNIHTLLVVLALLPVSTATAERSFSTLGRIFIDQRTSMTPKRVSQLAICSTYKKELDELNLEEVVNMFAHMSKRRTDFL